MLYHMDCCQLRRSAEIIELLKIGWQPRGRLFSDASYIDQWALLRSEGEGVYRLVGQRWSLPMTKRIVTAPLIAINVAAGWARLAEEWAVIGEPLAEALQEFVEADQVLRLATSWLRQRLLEV